MFARAFARRGSILTSIKHDALFHEEEEQREVVFGLVVVFRRFTE